MQYYTIITLKYTDYLYIGLTMMRFIFIFMTYVTFKKLKMLQSSSNLREVFCR